MSGEIPTPEEIKMAEAGERHASIGEASDISQLETEFRSGDPIKQGPISFVQSDHSKQRNFDNKVEEILAKSPDTITRQDAKELRSLEGRMLGTAPGMQSLSAEVQSIAELNEEIAAATAAHAEDDEPYILVPEEDTIEGQSHGSEIIGRRDPHGSRSVRVSSRIVADKRKKPRPANEGNY
ncbi:uncharacterized protein PADG_02890 [Paracoccidioides brasiliensis Pb18]|uniref:SMP domain-containing protein n=2 Tax=Paracoccidioides brasiliensis TaxID=121759 RepID=C1G6T5_PARBD|nr:uncharacterized protein PADG_02890 [Paracoccidioides brasiliensis Pb18]EEH46792.2 hypothetical protein PADG_02890 [Paracoccidioides brasiliensis Pb18]ODH13607.1 hypothetical protein ACO22_07093 [Paracoccidioides brasiliensis]ODH48353.1 hypothetical protein GX48_05555 [Paracoccidioides brasiliensis]